jgi:hypothetical protein
VGTAVIPAIGATARAARAWWEGTLTALENTFGFRLENWPPNWRPSFWLRGWFPAWLHAHGWWLVAVVPSVLLAVLYQGRASNAAFALRGGLNLLPQSGLLAIPLGCPADSGPLICVLLPCELPIQILVADFVWCPVAER